MNVTKRERAREALLASEERFRTLVDSIDDIIFTLDAEQRHTGVYGRWLVREGFEPAFFLGRTTREILGDAVEIMG